MANARGIVNKNPGNLVKTKKLWPGEISLEKNTDRSFKQFTSMDFGLQALMRNLLSYFRSGNNTINKILDKWDPEPDDNTEYKKSVSKSTGYGVSETLLPEASVLIRLTRAIVDFENGSNNITNSQISQAYDNLSKVYNKNVPGQEEKKIPGKKIFLSAALVSATFMYFNRD